MKDFLSVFIPVLVSGCGGWTFGHLGYMAYSSWRTDRWREAPQVGDECYFVMANGGRQYGHVTHVIKNARAARIEFARLKPGGPVRLEGIYGVERLFPAGRPAYGSKTERNALQRAGQKTA